MTLCKRFALLALNLQCSNARPQALLKGNAQSINVFGTYFDEEFPDEATTKTTKSAFLASLSEKSWKTAALQHTEVSKLLLAVDKKMANSVVNVDPPEKVSCYP